MLMINYLIFSTNIKSRIPPHSPQRKQLPKKSKSSSLLVGFILANNERINAHNSYLLFFVSTLIEIVLCHNQKKQKKSITETESHPIHRQDEYCNNRGLLCYRVRLVSIVWFINNHLSIVYFLVLWKIFLSVVFLWRAIGDVPITIYFYL